MRIRKTEKYKPHRPVFVDGIKKSPEDKRDIDAVRLSVTEIPDVVSLREFAPAVKNQGNIGSCFFHALCSGMELLMNKNKMKWNLELSERFGYYVYRDNMGLLPQDCGTFMREGCKFANQIGIAPEMTCPYITTKFNEKPSGVAYAFSRFWKIKKYNRCWSVTDIMSELSRGFPVLLGIKVPRNFITWKKSRYELKDVSGDIVGGHAILVTGHNKLIKTLEMLNSWNGWGSLGYCNLGYDFVRKNFIEAWSIEM